MKEIPPILEHRLYVTPHCCDIRQHVFTKTYTILFFSVFGRTMMNLRNRVNIKLVNNERALKKLVAKPSFERFQIFTEDMVGVENKMTTLFMNQPIYAGN